MHAMDYQKQVDLILLDFSKPFDTVPHQCLLTELKHYGIPEDSFHLQKDLDRIFNWTTHWQMQFNVQKCVVLQCTRSYSPEISNYVINGHILKLKHQHI